MLNNSRARLNFFTELIDKRHLAFLAKTNLPGSPQFNELAVVARCEIAPSATKLTRRGANSAFVNVNETDRPTARISATKPATPRAARRA